MTIPPDGSNMSLWDGRARCKVILEFLTSSALHEDEAFVDNYALGAIMSTHVNND